MVKSGEKPRKGKSEADAPVTMKVKKVKKSKSVAATEDLNGSAEPALVATAEEQPPSAKKHKKRKVDEAPEAVSPAAQEQQQKKKKKKSKETGRLDDVASPTEPAAGEAARGAAELVKAEVSC